MMQMTRIIFDFMIGIFSTNPDDLYDPTVDFIGWRFIGAPFTPRPDLVKSDLTLIDDGLVAPFVAANAAYQRLETTVEDPNAWTITRASASSFYDVQADGTVLPLTVYGVAFLGHDQDDLWFVQAFDTPKILLNTDQGFTFDQMIATLPATMLITD